MVQLVASTGKTATLPCPVTVSEDTYALEWRRDGQIVFSAFGDGDGDPALPFKGRLARGTDRSLTIHAVRPSDAGIYQCTIKLFNRPADHPTGPRVELFVHSKPTIAEFATVDFYRAIGEQVVLECSADGSPKPAVQWLLDGRRVVDEQSRILIRDGRLEITDLKATDEGEYKCVASNDEGTAERSARISFAKAPHFEFAPRNRTALDGSSFFWRCDARADPNQLTYRWFFGDKEVKFSDLGLRSVIEEGDLRISPIHRSDSGWYRCVASNGFGAEASASAYLDVQYQAQVLSSTPQVQTLPLGLPADLHCDVDANPSASFVNWAKDGRVLSVGNDTRYDRVETGAALRITGVERSDAGLYTCQAYNAIGGSSPYEIHVLVSEPPFYTVTPEPNSYRREGEDVTLFCGGGGTPEPKIYWRRKDGRPLSARAKEEGRATLSINNIHYEDHGVYECIVQNDIATLSKEAVVVVDDTRPQQPTDVRAVSRVDGAHISWKPAFDGGHEQTFTIRYRILDSSDAWQVVDAGQRSEFDVTNLRPSTTYEFLVEPKNVKGIGFSTPAVVETQGDLLTATPSDDAEGNLSPPDAETATNKLNPPRNLRVSSDKYDKVLLEWDKPFEPSNKQPKAQFYQLEYKRAGQPGKPAVDDTPDDAFQVLRDQIVDTKLLMGPGSAEPIQAGNAYHFRVRSRHHNYPPSDPSNVVRYIAPGISPHVALTAAILGGLLFFLLFVVLGCIMLKRNRRGKTDKQQQKQMKINYANGSSPRDYNYPSPMTYDDYDGAGSRTLPLKTRNGHLTAAVALSRCSSHSQSLLPTNNNGAVAVPKARVFDYSSPRRSADRFEYDPPAGSKEYAFEWISSTLRIGSGVTAEVGMDVRNLGAKKTMVLTDDGVSWTPAFLAVVDSLKAAGQKFDVFNRVRVEPTDTSMLDAIEAARCGQFDSFVAVGGGSTIDTAKVAALYASNTDADFFDFVAKPFGKALTPTKPMLPLIAVPTTSGTGSETTGVAIFDYEEKDCKTAIRHRCIKPLLALVDPQNVKTLPRHVVIYSGFDVLCHALESYTALPFDQRTPRPADPSQRPVYQGSNPISDVWAREALQIVSKYFRRAVNDPEDVEARSQMLFASSMAGSGFGNAGVHLCHGLSYPISSQVKSFRSEDYPPDHALIPHGLSVVMTACADFQFTSAATPERHAQAARFLGAKIEPSAKAEIVGGALSDLIKGFMQDFRVPNGLSELGFGRDDVGRLTNAAINSLSALQISPRQHTTDAIAKIYEDSFTVY